MGHGPEKRLEKQLGVIRDRGTRKDLLFIQMNKCPAVKVLSSRQTNTGLRAQKEKRNALSHAEILRLICRWCEGHCTAPGSTSGTAGCRGKEQPKSNMGRGYVGFSAVGLQMVLGSSAGQFSLSQLQKKLSFTTPLPSACPLHLAQSTDNSL